MGKMSDKLCNPCRVGSNPFLGTKGNAFKPANIAGLVLNTGNASDSASDKKTGINLEIESFMANPKKEIIPYKLAKIYEGGEDVFIYFYYWSQSKQAYVRKKVRPVRRGVNLPRQERLALLRETLPVVNSELKARNAKGIYHEELTGVNGARSYTGEILSIINEKKLPKSTLRQLSSYRSSFLSFEELKERTYTTFDVTMEVLEQFRDYLRSAKHSGESKKVYANKTINEYLWAANVVGDILRKNRLSKEHINTADLHVKKIKNQTLKYRPLTHEEKEAIFNHTRENNPPFYLYLLHIYYTCIRFSEAKRLQIKNYDLAGRKILVPWYTAKNGLTDHVQILAPLGEALRDANVKNYAPSFYLFGKNFLPGKQQYTGKNDSDIWRRECRKIGIPDDVRMYGLKHTFNVDYVENNINNINWEWLRRHNRHRTIQQTQDYIYSLMPHFLDETQSTILNYYKK